MIFKRIIYALLYRDGSFHLSRNFRLQKVGDVNWLKDNFGFGETCDYIDELMIINVTQEPTKKDFEKYFNDIDLLRKKIFVPITLGGGIRNFSNAKACFDNGADKILINYLAHKNLSTIEEISKIYGEQAISIMVDFKLEGKEFFTYVNSGKIKSLSLNSFLKSLKNLKFGEIILNSIDRDGTAAGLEMKSLDILPNDFNNPVLLMGGAGKPEHFFEVLNNSKISGLITANLFNFLGSGLEEARQFSLRKNINLIKFSKITNE